MKVGKRTGSQQVKLQLARLNQQFRTTHLERRGLSRTGLGGRGGQHAQHRPFQRGHIDLNTIEARTQCGRSPGYQRANPRHIALQHPDIGIVRALVVEKEFGIGPSLVLLPQHVGLTHYDVVEEHLVHGLAPIDGINRPHRHAWRIHWHQKHRDGGLRLAVGICARQADHVIGIARVAGPGLLAGNEPALPLAHRPGLDAREVGARARLRKALAEIHFTVEDGLQKTPVLFGRAESADQGADQIERDQMLATRLYCDVGPETYFTPEVLSLRVSFIWEN